MQAWSADNEIGTVKVVAWNVIAPVSGEVIFANLTFKAVGMGGSSSPLNLTVRDLTDYETYEMIPYTLSNGSIRVSYNQSITDIIRKVWSIIKMRWLV